MEKRDLPRRACIAAVDVIVFANLISLLLSTRPRFQVVLLFLASPNPLVPVTPGPFPLRLLVKQHLHPVVEPTISLFCVADHAVDDGVLLGDDVQ